MIQSLTGLIHTITAGAALLSGMIIFARPKGTHFHKAMGYTYSISMIVLILTAFSIYHLTKTFNFLHIAAIISCPPLALGLAAAITRRPKGEWLVRHYYWISWSYIGLCSAFVAEAMTRIVMPYVYGRFGLHSMALFWMLVAVASSAVTLPGWYFVERNRKLIAEFQNKKAQSLNQQP